MSESKNEKASRNPLHAELLFPISPDSVNQSALHQHLIDIQIIRNFPIKPEVEPLFTTKGGSR